MKVMSDVTVAFYNFHGCRRERNESYGDKYGARYGGR